MLAIEYFDRAAERYPDRVAVTDGTTSYTFRELSIESIRIARALVASGVKAGEAVAILSPNHPNVLTCQYAILRAGCVWVPTNSRNAVDDTLQQVLKFEVKWLFFHTALQNDVDVILTQAAGLRGSIAIDVSAEHGDALHGWHTGAAVDVVLPHVDMDDVMYLGSTGGTTGGQLKGALHTNRGWELAIANSWGLLRFRNPVVHLAIAPLTHACGMFHWLVVGRGATLVICPSADPATILDMVEQHRVTFMFFPPTILYMLLSHPGLALRDLSSLEQLVIGAAPVSFEKLREAVEVFGPIICQGYGQTEALILNMFLSSEELAEAARDPALEHRLASTGREGPLTRIEIMDDEGVMLPIGERGEIVMRSGMVMLEYYKDPERTELARAFGWHHTGDIGWRDEDGYIYIADRKHDIIISGGFNVYPGEIEQVILSHPAIQDCVVVGVPHEKWGEMVLAAVELKAGEILDEPAFMSFCRERLGGVRTPKALEILGSMPRSAVGKTLRRVVRDRHWAGHARKI